MTLFYSLPLKDRIRQNGGILDCPACSQDLYRFTGKRFRGKIKAKTFVSVQPDKFGNPSDGDPARCPLCGALLFYEVFTHRSPEDTL